MADDGADRDQGDPAPARLGQPFGQNLQGRPVRMADPDGIAASARVPLQDLELAPHATLQLAYLPRLFGVEYFPWVYLAVWAPPAVWWLGDALTHRSSGGPAAVDAESHDP